jgi:hypothetical protein
LSALKNKFYSLNKYRKKRSQADEIENKNDSNQQMNKSNQNPHQDQDQLYQPAKRMKLETKVTSFPSVQQSESISEICELSSDDLFQCQETLDPIESTESIQPAHSGQPARSNCSIADNGPLHGVQQSIADAKFLLQRHQQQVENQIKNNILPISTQTRISCSPSQSNFQSSTQLEYMNPNRNETYQLNESCSSSCFPVRPRSVPATRAAKFKWTTEEVNETKHKYNII